MIDKKLNQRQKNVLLNIDSDKDYSISDIVSILNSVKNVGAISIPTVRRDISELVKLDFLRKKGKLKSTTYRLTILGMLLNPINPHAYCEIDIDKRNGKSSYNFSLFENFPVNIFSREEMENLNNATKKYLEKSKGTSETLIKKELERFVIELSWKSSKIEGNTYTLLDTELLIKEGIEAPGHKKDEAIMILNHKKALEYILSFKDQYKKSSVRLIEDLHKILAEGLGVSFGLRERQVGVTGTKYTPLSVPTQINEALVDLCRAIDKAETPYQKAFLALIGISYVQPFEDGNKRTGRLFANAILLAYDCAPLSYRSVDEVNYRESVLVFYEKNSIESMLRIFMEQYLFACENYLKI